MKLKPILYLAILIGIYSCKNITKNKPSLNGVWNTIGYGKQFIITDSIVTIYDIYERGCSFNSQLTKELFDNKYNITKLTIDSLTLRSGFTDYGSIRVNSKASICGENSKSADPLTNFDALWNTFSEYYPSFKLRGIVWQESKEKYRSKLDSQSTDLELYTTLSEMISELNDEHVSIDIPEVLNNEADEAYKSDKLRESVIKLINTKYVDSLKIYNGGIINWGIISSRIGYIQINDFENLANYSIDQELSVNEFWKKYSEKASKSKNYRKDNLNGVKELMPQILQDIKYTKSCIIDVRFNGGGFDEVGLEVLSYFSDRKTIAFSKKAKFKNGFTQSQTIYVEPNDQMYNGNIYILTSFQTASAAEIFVLASQNLPSITTIGSNTMGILSDILTKKLPNGWTYGLSSEIYESADGNNYERNGIPADIDLNYEKNSADFYNNLLLSLKKEDLAIEKVIEINTEKTAPNN